MDATSLYEKERKQEFDSMEFERLQRECWVSILSHNITDEKRVNMISEIERNIQDQIAEKYNAHNFKFDREKREIKFEIDCEEIIL
jgi:hypothetical protein